MDPYVRLFFPCSSDRDDSRIDGFHCTARLCYRARLSDFSPELAAFASVATGTSLSLLSPCSAASIHDGCPPVASLPCSVSMRRYVAFKPGDCEAGNALAIWVLTLAGAIGGANRQIVWAAPITLIPYLAWVRRTDKGFSTHAVAAYGGISAAIPGDRSLFWPALWAHWSSVIS